MVMKMIKKNLGDGNNYFVEHVKEKSWTYIKTIVDVAHEPILILDKDLRVMGANDSFYRTFQVEPNDTEKRVVYELGNGQWNIASLRKLLDDILPKNTFFKGFEVAHEFPVIGRKVMILNARQIYFEKNAHHELFPQIILLAIEDITEVIDIAKMLAHHTNLFQVKMAEKTGKLEYHIKELKREISELKQRL